MSKISEKILTIGIDARFYGPLGKGLGRYTKELVDRLVELDRKNRYVVFLCKENYDEFEADGDRVKKVRARSRWYSFFEQIEIPWLIRKYSIDLMDSPHFNVPLLCPAKLIVTIHDLILTRFPTPRASTLSPFFYRIKHLVYRFVIRRAVQRAFKVIAVSEYTRKDIMTQFGTEPDKIIVTYEGVSKGFDRKVKERDFDVVLGYNIDRPYIVYVGNAYPHKNLEGLVNIFPKIKEKIPDIRLVLVGKVDYFYSRLKELVHKRDLEDKIIFPGYIPDRDLAVLLRYAACYVFPSFYEGFGLPPLEAMTHGCPVASSDQTSMPEILGNAAYYFDPGKPDSMSDAVVEIITNQKLRQGLIEAGRERVKLYDWKECARKTLKIYQQSIKE